MSAPFFPGPFGLFGVELIIIPDPMIEVARRRHPRKKRRLQKKWRKRYGTEWIVDPNYDPNTCYFDQARGKLYCSRRAQNAIFHMLDRMQLDGEPLPGPPPIGLTSPH